MLLHELLVIIAGDQAEDLMANNHKSGDERLIIDNYK